MSWLYDLRATIQCLGEAHSAVDILGIPVQVSLHVEWAQNTSGLHRSVQSEFLRFGLAHHYPYSAISILTVSLAFLMTSSSVSKVLIWMTGPKISSFITTSSSAVFRKTVGEMK